MIANYHTHTWRCNHAERGEESYIRTAYHAGIRTLGFADHVPYPYETIDPEYISGPRMGCDLLENYMITLIDLKEKYKGLMDIHIGFEAEYYPDLFPHLMEMLSPWQGQLEYFILGQHFLGNEVGEVYCGVPTDDPARMAAYVEQCKAAMDTGRFTYFAHPDLLKLTGDSATYRQYARDLCHAAKGYGLPLEFNLLGFLTRRHYPNPVFWEEVAVVGNEVILGWDAHAVGWMDQPQGEADARAYLATLGITPMDSVALVDPFTGRKST